MARVESDHVVWLKVANNRGFRSRKAEVLASCSHSPCSSRTSNEVDELPKSINTAFIEYFNTARSALELRESCY